MGHVVHGFKRINNNLYHFDVESGSLQIRPQVLKPTVPGVDGNWYYAQFSKYINGVRGAILTNAFTFIAVDDRYPTSPQMKMVKLTQLQPK